jgi:hypothetical protein
VRSVRVGTDIGVRMRLRVWVDLGPVRQNRGRADREGCSASL